MNAEITARAETTIGAPIERVWKALTDPSLIKKYFFGVDTLSDWHVGSSVVWRGEWEGKPFEDRGTVLKAEENRVLSFTHYSPLSGNPDSPEYYHTITIELGDAGDKTKVTVTQENNETDEVRQHSEKNWTTVLSELKKLLET